MTSKHRRFGDLGTGWLARRTVSWAIAAAVLALGIVGQTAPKCSLITWKGSSAADAAAGPPPEVKQGRDGALAAGIILDSVPIGKPGGVKEAKGDRR